MRVSITYKDGRYSKAFDIECESRDNPPQIIKFEKKYFVFYEKSCYGGLYYREYDVFDAKKVKNIIEGKR